MASIGVLVVGRHVFDITDGWEGRPPAGGHMVVVFGSGKRYFGRSTASTSWRTPTS